MTGLVILILTPALLPHLQQFLKQGHPAFFHLTGLEEFFVVLEPVAVLETFFGPERPERVSAHQLRSGARRHSRTGTALRTKVQRHNADAGETGAVFGDLATAQTDNVCASSRNGCLPGARKLLQVARSDSLQRLEE